MGSVTGTGWTWSREPGDGGGQGDPVHGTDGAAMSAHVITPRETANSIGKRRWLATCSCGWTGIVAKTPERAVRAGTTDHADKQLPPCPTPSKRRFGTRESAERELNKFWRTSGRGKVMPCRTYNCDCGSWHTTAKPSRKAVAQ